MLKYLLHLSLRKKRKKKKRQEREIFLEIIKFFSGWWEDRRGNDRNFQIKGHVARPPNEWFHSLPLLGKKFRGGQSFVEVRRE